MNKLSLTSTLRFITLSAAVVYSCGATAVFADSGGGTPVSVDVSAGILSFAASDYATLSPVRAPGRTDTTATGTLGTFSVADSRGTHAGWNVYATFSDLSSYDTFLDASGEAGPFTVHGSYTGTKSLDLTLMTGDPSGSDGLGDMSYTLTDKSGKRYTNGSAGTLNSSNQIVGTGLSFDAPSITYDPNTAYHLHIGVIPASGYTVSSGSPTSDNGSLDSLMAGDTCQPANDSDPCLLLRATTGTQDGLYLSSANLQLTVPAGTNRGSYKGQIVETVQ